jgi:hypothetical protein
MIKIKSYCFLVFTLLLLPTYVYALEVQGKFSLENGQVYEDYAYVAYSIEATGNPLSIEVNSEKLDTYLIVQAPDKSFSTNDQFHGDNAGITIKKPSSGQWIIIATTYGVKEVGNFRLVVNGATKIIPITKEQLNKKLVEDAFAEREVYSEEKQTELEKERKKKEEIENARKINLLADQLTLASYRAELRINLNNNINDKDNEDYAEKVKRLENLIAEEKKLKNALSEAKKLSANKIIIPIIKKEIESNSYDISELSKELSEQVAKQEAFKMAQQKIQELDKLSKELESLKQGLLNAKDYDSFGSYKNKISQLQIKVKQLAKEIAENLFNSSFVQYLQLGAVGYHPDYERDYSYAAANASIAAISMNSSQLSKMAPAYDKLSSKDIDPTIWLPELFPWPPPAASSMVILDDYYNPKHNFKSLGEVDKLIRNALDSTGYPAPHYFGVPNGFALITQLEQIDDNAVPLDGVARRWSTNISEMKAFTLTEYLKALITAQPGYYRVIAFIVSSQPFSTTDDRAKFSTIQNWVNKGISSLPKKIKSQKYSDEHQTTVLVYEFLKRKTTDEPSTSIPCRHIAKVHLEKTKILSYLKN